MLAVRDLTIEYTSGGYKVRPINDLNIDVESGELVLLLGASGCGKTTLLSALATLLTPTAGTIHVGDVEVTSLARPRARRLPAQDGRRRVPGVQPDPEPQRARERRGAARAPPRCRGARRGPAPSSCSTTSA